MIPMPSDLVVLFGPPGAPVDQVAQALAELGGLPLRNTDDDVAARAGMPLSDVLIDLGEATYRELERAAVEQAIRDHRGVLVVGGGAVLDPHVQHLLHQPLAGGLPVVVFLDVSLAEAAKNLHLNLSVPTPLINPRTQWLRMLAERRPTYEDVATLHVETAGRDPHDLAAQLLGHLNATG